MNEINIIKTYRITDIMNATIKNRINRIMAFLAYSFTVVYLISEKNFVPSQIKNSNCITRRTKRINVPSLEISELEKILTKMEPNAPARKIRA